VLVPVGVSVLTAVGVAVFGVEVAAPTVVVACGDRVAETVRVLSTVPVDKSVTVGVGVRVLTAVGLTVCVTVEVNVCTAVDVRGGVTVRAAAVLVVCGEGVANTVRVVIGVTLPCACDVGVRDAVGCVVPVGAAVCVATAVCVTIALPLQYRLSDFVLKLESTR